MTNEEAIKIIKECEEKGFKHTFYTLNQYHEALNMAIKALEQVPTDDATLKDIFCMGCEYKEQEPSGETVSLEAYKQVMWERDIAIEQLHELGYGFGQKIESCEVAINRQDAINVVEDMHGLARADVLSEAVKQLKDLPPVTPKPQTGHWTEEGINVRCSNCGKGYKEAFGRTSAKTYNYCPNCGCRMIEPQESEDKE